MDARLDNVRRRGKPDPALRPPSKGHDDGGCQWSILNHGRAFRSAEICLEQSHERAPEENKAIVLGSIAYFGTYSIDEATHVLTVNIEGSTFPNFTAGGQTRILSFDGDEVTYFNPTPSMGGSAKVTYRRAK